MRTIQKSREPDSLTQWRCSQQGGYKHYQEKSDLLEHLIAEQGHLCAYTMLHIKADSSHVEHIVSQDQDATKTLDYDNMVACFPKNGGDVSHGYGAPFKKETPIQVNENFVSPLQPRCETRFRFDARGEIHAVRADDLAAVGTIAILGLAHPALSELRREAMKGLGFIPQRKSQPRSGRGASPMTPVQARRFAERVVQFEGNRLEPFCVALAQAALIYADKEEARAKGLHVQQRR